MKRLGILIICLNLAILSCSDDSDDVAAKADKEIMEYLALRNLTAQRTDDGMYYIINFPGSEEKPVLTSSVTVHYQGKLINGRVFDSSFGKEPANFRLEDVIKGWQKGIPLIGRGGKIVLFIPPQLGYGNTAQQGIPANSVLIFDVELIDFQ